MFNTLKYYKFWFTVSGLILAFGIISLSLYGLKLGIDFRGGTLLEVRFDKPFDLNRVRQALSQEGLKNYQLQTSENNDLLIKSEALDQNQHNAVAQALQTEVGTFKEVQYNSIGPVIGSELKKDALYQLLLVSLGIVIYIGYAFRKVAKPVTSWRFGWSAIVALMHDLLFVLGVFSLLGHFKGVEIDSMFVTAMLTVLGFSVHDTIVVFDRIRENLRIFAGQSIEFVVNHSISQTIVRSLNTSLTVLFVLLALLLFGGDSIRYFVFALFIGIITGTYSSIFIASPVLVLWQNWKTKRIS
ncbi:MAG: protein translocase subunit SecF [Patescibacteria group bacterium]|nr:protein translocase subunit SecF [Patescibacteria group bacterium]